MQFDWMRYVRGAAIVLVLSVLFTFFGIYNNGHLNFIGSMTVWVPTIGTGMLASLFVTPVVFEKPPMMSLSPWLQIPIAASVIAMPVTGVLIIVYAVTGINLPVTIWHLLFRDVLVVSLVLTTSAWFAYIRAELQAKLSAASDGQNAHTEQVFLSRLPARYHGAQLHAITSEDHYLRVYTDLGEELILMRLTDAIALLASADGLQVHRSWWVSRAGVADVARENGKPTIILKSGAKAPVSRTFQPAARNAGLI